MVLNRELPRFECKAAHLYPYRAAKELHKIRLDKSEINNPRNGLLLAAKIEEAFAEKEVCFVWNSFNFEFLFYVLNPARLNLHICSDSSQTFGDRHNKALRLPLLPQGTILGPEHPLYRAQVPEQSQQLRYPKVLPFRRVLGYHARAAFKKAYEKKWIQKGDYDAFQDYMALSDKALDAQTLLDGLNSEKSAAEE